MSDFNATKYKNEFNKESYDRVSINFRKGQKAVIEAHWKAKGYKSLNAYVNDLITQDMGRTEDYNHNRFSIRFSNRTRNNKKEVTRGLKIPVQTIPHAQPMQNQINQ